jgi:hypothetical protein
MAGSKNNPANKNKMKVVERTCEICGKTGPIDSEIQRVHTIVNKKKRLIWKCKNSHY